MTCSSAKFDGPYNTCEIHIKRDEDWRETVVLQQLNADGTVADLDFTYLTKLELFIRPRFNHDTRIALLSSDASAILFSQGKPGEITFVMDRAAVIATIPIGVWDQFLVGTYADGSINEFWRGPLTVHAGKVS